MRIQSLVKEVLEAVLPESAMVEVRKLHYRHKLRSMSPSAEPDLAIAVKLLAPGESAVDAGANYGLYSRFFSEAVGPSGHVISIEPIPSTFAVLKANVAALGLKNVNPVNEAVSDKPGQVTMEIPIQGGGKNFYQAHIIPGGDGHASASTRTFTVRSSAIDDLVGGLMVSLMKVDVEGHELPCINGALKTLRTHQPALLIEVSGDPDGTGPAQQLVALLDTMGYKPYASDGLAVRPRAQGMRSVNYFFLKDTHLQRLRKNGVAVHG